MSELLYTVHNGGGAAVVSDVPLSVAADYLTDERLARGWSACGCVLISTADELREALAAAPQGEPVAFHELLREAEAEVRAKPVWTRYIDGTPLANDVPVWMAVFAQYHARAPAPQPSADPWRDAVDQMLATTEQTASDDPRESLHRLIDWHVSVALDPLVSSDAAALVQRGRDEVAAQQSAEYEKDFDMCPNCVTPWKCNGPHITQPSAEPSDELVRAARDAVTIPRIVAEQALRYVETGDPHGRLRVLDALRRALATRNAPATKGETT